MTSKCINGELLCTGVGIVDGQHNNFIKLLKKNPIANFNIKS